ncbi:MAG: rRNA maturation RNase YbeY [Candidatus Izimaplasma sp.]|nr:rRNA maturation RNase YbeY [Candidatus Izimaplasma bacterium]
MKITITNSYDEKDYSSITKKIADVADKHLAVTDKLLSLILVDNQEITRLNKQFRDKDMPTDVLTFVDGELNHLGDVFVSLDKTKEQANTYNHSFDRELGFLIVHGLLHTLGYTHDTKDTEDTMFSLQNKLLKNANLKRS